MSEGNGKTPAPVVNAQRAVDAAEKRVKETERPLKDLDQQILVAQAKLNKANEELAVAAENLQTAADNLADGEAGAGTRHAKAAAIHNEATAKSTVLHQRLAALQAQRPALDAAYQAASVTHSKAMQVLKLEIDRVELARCKFHLAQAQEQVIAWQKKTNEVADRCLALQRQFNEEQQREMNERARQAFRRANPQQSGFERTRNSM